MKLALTIIVAICFNVLGHGQTYSINTKLGYSRVGVYANPNIKLHFKAHGAEIGVKYYGYNLYFENRPIGIKFGYSYSFQSSNQKVYFYPSFSIGGFRENKQASNLILGEFNVSNGIGFFVSNHLSIIQEIGIGYVTTRNKVFNTNNTFKSAFPNYEISVGLVYHFGGNDELSKTE